MEQEPSKQFQTAEEVQEPHIGSGKKTLLWRSITSTAVILVAAPLIALLLTAFVFQSYQVDGSSMETTLHDQDRLIVWKASRTLAKLTKHPYVPNRSDIIIFNKSGVVTKTGIGEKQLVKRVIGLPGDRVVIKDGQITIYNKTHPEGFNPDNGHEFSQNIFKPTGGNVDTIVADGNVYVCGDNRGNSTDSRSFGYVSADAIVGTLVIRIFPLNSFKSYI